MARSDNLLHGGGLAIVVNSRIYDILGHDSGDTLAYGNRAEWLYVDVQDHVAGRRFRLVNVYLRPGAQINFRALLTFFSSELHADVIGGDFNARHPSWDPGEVVHDRGGFARGAHLLRWSGYTGFKLSTTAGHATPTTTGGRSAVDLFLFAERVKWAPHLVVVLSNTSEVQSTFGGVLSDHYPIIVNIPTRRHPAAARRVRQIRWPLVTPAHLRHVTLCIRSTPWAPEAMFQTIRRCVRALPRITWRAGILAAHVIPVDICDLPTAWRAVSRQQGSGVSAFALKGRDEGETYCGPLAKAQALNRVFAAKHDVRFLPHLPRSDVEVCRDLGPCPTPPPISVWEVRTAIRNLKPTGAPDNDGISPRLLQWCIGPLSESLPAVYNQILDDPSLFPASWKDTTIVPLLKTGKDPRLLGSYRPVCVYSPLSRTLEGIVARRLASVVVPGLHERQYGFKPGRSPSDVLGAVVGTALLACGTTKNSVQGSTRRATRQPGRGLAAYLDLSDAFCRVPHRVLLDVLLEWDVITYLARFIRHWIYGRHAFTFANGRYSQRALLEAGVPQGSVVPT